jgi:hypothetical protein
MLFYRPLRAEASILGDRIILDLIEELEDALSVIEATERRSRSTASCTRLTAAAAAVDAAVVYLRELRG